jgi:hypothetical protein
MAKFARGHFDGDAASFSANVTPIGVEFEAEFFGVFANERFVAIAFIAAELMIKVRDDQFSAAGSKKFQKRHRIHTAGNAYDERRPWMKAFQSSVESGFEVHRFR